MREKYEDLKMKGYDMLDHRTRKLSGISKQDWWIFIFNSR
tara:strand:+ start:2919 stop:3038 length:120 start_codon:yes stop_codon:yes gene_type:complete